MRALVLLFLAPVLAGCLTLGTPLGDNALGALGFDAAAIVAEGATVERLADAVRLVWESEVPPTGKAVGFIVPRGVTMVDARVEWPEDLPRLTMPVRESGPYRRCARFEDLEQSAFTCRGLTVLDELPAPWTFDLQPLGPTNVPIPFRMEVRLSAQPLDGPAALLRLDQLSRADPSLRILEEAPVYVEASDGVALYVEVTRPDVEAKVPTILTVGPYHNVIRAAGLRPYRDAPYNTIPDYVPRGYAFVVADVRGFGNSGGCVEVWGPKEQQDVFDLVEWVAAQEWSDGNVGLFGQSYVGTTALMGAVMQAPHLKAVVSVAPVANPYEDWHFGGVPNGENTGSPLGYQMTGSEVAAGEADTMTTAELLAGSYCGTAPLVAEANDPRAVYDEFYEARNLSARASEVQVPVLYTQGHFDNNVKSQMAVHWFDALPEPKKGLFGPWFHRHPPRPDQDLYFHAWFDQFLKGKDTGILDTPTAEIQSLQGTWRGAAAWPGTDAQPWSLHLDAAGEALSEEPTKASDAGYTALPVRSLDDVAAMAPLWPFPQVPLALPGESLRFALPPLDAARVLSGAAMLDLTLTLEGADNTFVAAYLYEQDGEELRPITFGWRNAALRNGYETYEPAPRGEPFALTVPFNPTEWVLAPGRALVLEVRYPTPSDWAGGMPGEPGRVTLHTGDGMSVLRLPTLSAVPGASPQTTSVA